MKQEKNYFGVSSQRELLEYIRKNPSDEKVKELKELMLDLGIEIGDGNE